MLPLIVQNQANGTLAHFGGILVRRFAHDAPSYSGIGASGKPGGVQCAGGVQTAQTLYNCFIRWSRLSVFDQIFTVLSSHDGPPGQLQIDATHLKAHRLAALLLKNGDVPRAIGRTKGGLNSKLNAICDGLGRPVAMVFSKGQMSDYNSAKHLLDDLLYKQRHKVENMFTKLKDWHRIATRYDRCARTFCSAICIAAIVIW